MDVIQEVADSVIMEEDETDMSVHITNKNHKFQPFEHLALDLQDLREEEEEHLKNVMEKLKAVQQMEDNRIKKLTSKMHNSPSLKETTQKDFNCKLCGGVYIIFIRPQYQCSNCQCFLCKRCISVFNKGTVMLCPVCLKDSQWEGQTGRWFREINQKWLTGLDIIRKSLRRHAEIRQQREQDDRQRAIEEAEAKAEAERERKAAEKAAAQQTKIELTKNPATNSGENLSNYVHKTVVINPAATIQDKQKRQVQVLNESNKPAIHVKAEQHSRVPDSHVPMNMSLENLNEDESDEFDSSIQMKGASMAVSQPDLHRLPGNFAAGSSLSLASSVYSDGGSSQAIENAVVVQGDINFHLSYNDKTSSFTVHILECRNLAPFHPRKKKLNNVYVKTYLLPDRTKSSKKKTKIEHNTLNPKFHTELTYTISKHLLLTRVLWVSVYHQLRFSQNIFLGEVQLHMKQQEDVFKVYNNPQWFPLQPKAPKFYDQSGPHIDKGELIFALKYVPGKNPLDGEVIIWLREARNLIGIRPSGSSNPFCKALLLPDKKNKQKTTVCKTTTNPKWDQPIKFQNVPADELPSRSLEITIWDHSKFASNEFLGGVKLNLGNGISYGQSAKWMNAIGAEVEAWKNMINYPNRAFESTITLRANMD